MKIYVNQQIKRFKEIIREISQHDKTPDAVIDVDQNQAQIYKLPTNDV